MVSQRKRRLCFGLGLTAALVLAVGVSPAAASHQVFAVGGGTVGSAPGFDLSGSHFAFSAHCTSANGCTPSTPGTVSGYAVVSHPVFGKAQGHVCDFAALGGEDFGFSAASFAIVVEGGRGPLGSAPFLGFIAGDFGPPGGPVPDGLGVFPEEECVAIGAPSAFAVPIVRGNIVVEQQ
jgi:hypothetical protein